MMMTRAYQRLLKDFLTAKNIRDPRWQEVCEQGQKRFCTQGLPDNKGEAYRYTPLEKRLFPAVVTLSEEYAPSIKYLWEELPGYHVFLVEGEEVKGLPLGVEGAWVGVKGFLPAYATHIGAYARTEEDPFIALNSGCFQHVFSLHVKEGCSVDLPIYLHHLGTPFSVVHPRSFFFFGKASQVQVVDIVYGRSAPQFVNEVTEHYIDEGAQVTHCLWHCAQNSFSHVLRHEHSTLATQAVLRSFSLLLGGSFFRNHQVAHLRGEAAEAMFYGSYLATQKGFLETHNSLVHHVPYTRGYTRYQGVGKESGQGVFRGIVDVKPGAQKTMTAQYHHGWALDKARIYARPELRIHADDVVCKHGATMGQGVDKALFYLRTRGIAADVARRLLLKGFMRTSWQSLPHDALKKHKEHLLDHFL